MIKKLHSLLLPLCMIPILLLSSCAGPYAKKESGKYLAYTIADHSNPTNNVLPVFLIEDPEKSFNLIGTPRVSTGEDSEETVLVEPETPTIYSQRYRFSTEKNSYTNVVYRIHFSETPQTYVPLQIGAGKNVGLLFIVTYDNEQRPVLITTLHTCGCYLAFVPTTFLPEAAFPETWQKHKRQNIYSQSLPSLLDYSKLDHHTARVVFQIENASHRIQDIRLASLPSLHGSKNRVAQIKPLQSLETLPTGDGRTLSFYETAGPRKGYVRNSEKISERLLISWWALDWRVGEDKKFTPGNSDEPVFYTSLKPWARQDSDIRNFPAFLKYWGWKL